MHVSGRQLIASITMGLALLTTICVSSLMSPVSSLPTLRRFVAGSNAIRPISDHVRPTSAEIPHAPTVCAVCKATLGLDLKRRCVGTHNSLELVRGKWLFRRPIAPRGPGAGADRFSLFFEACFVASNHCRVFQSQYPCAEWRSGSHVTEICSPLKSIENMKPTCRPLSRSKTPRPFESCASSAPPAIERPALTAE